MSTESTDIGKYRLFHIFDSRGCKSLREDSLLGSMVFLIDRSHYHGNFEEVAKDAVELRFLCVCPDTIDVQ